MSQRDVVAELRSAHLEAPEELRERIRLLAASAPPERRALLDRRRLLALLVPVAAAVAVAIVVTRPSHRAAVPVERTLVNTVAGTAAVPAHTSASPGADTGALKTFSSVAPSTTRPQRYSASLTLRVPTAAAVSDTTKRAVAVATALGGYVVSVHVNAGGTGGAADLVLKVPRANVRRAIARLAALGTITAEQVDIQDLGAGIATVDRTMQRLQRQLRDLRAQQQTPVVVRQIAAVSAQVARLQRTRAATLRAARYATVSLHVSTPAPKPVVHHGHGPLHGLGVAFRWIGIGAVYGLALGLPALLLLGLVWLGVRAIRRRRETALLSRP